MILIAHRGSNLPYLENTIEGIKKAIDNNADLVELDFRNTRDGKIVAYHDSRVNRLTDGKGKIANLSLEEIRHLSLKTKFGRYSWHIPTYDECIDFIDDKIGLLCEVKGEMPLEQLNKMVNYIKSNGLTKEIIFASRSCRILNAIKSINSKIPTAKFVSFDILFYPLLVNSPYIDILIINELIALDCIIKILRKGNVKVFISTVWELRSKAILRTKNVDGLFVNIR